jgi:plastocyanin
VASVWSHMNKILSALAVTAVAFGLSAPALAANKTVSVADDVFKAKTVTISKGNTVTWKWVGSNPHNVKFGGFQSKVQVNGTYKHRFTKRGTFKYLCTIHSGMTGKVVVK